ncbi:hypothetical protein B484DRAFT_484779, partial [Ochromonadaceae sp. CCMP2298]
MTACGVNYRPIGKVGDRNTGQQPDNAGKDKAKATAAAAKAAGGAAFVCNGCGGTGHKYKECNKTAHPDFNSSKLAWALSDVGKRLAAAGKSKSVNDRDDAGGKKPWEKKRGEHFHTDAPLLAALCVADESYLVTATVVGAVTPNDSITPLTVQALLDTGAVIDNYCSKAVGNYIRHNHPKSWSADTTHEPVNMAAIGTSTEPLDSRRGGSAVCIHTAARQTCRRTEQEQ